MNQGFDAAVLDSAVLDTLDAALRPLARLAVRHQIGLRRLEELLKLALLREAERSLPEGVRATDSHVHVLTGMHRRDIARLRAGASRVQGDGARHSLARLVLQRWTGDVDYIDEDGQALPLATTEREGGLLSFEALVRSVSTNVGHRALLDEWQRAGALVCGDDGRWRLQIAQAAYVMPLEQRLRMTGLRLHDLGLSLADDLVRERSQHFHLFVDATALTPQSAQWLTEQAHEIGRKAVASLNAKASALARQDFGKPEATMRASFGAYSHVAENGSTAPAVVNHIQDAARPAGQSI
jgi:Family of unknown function (DUF6502)